MVRHPKRLEIRNICGTEAHLRKLEDIGKNQIGRVEYLYLEIDDDSSDAQDSNELARQYLEVYRKYFGNIRILRLETIGDRNFTRMLQLMTEDPTFPWFDSVHTIKIYQIRNLKDMEFIKKWLTHFRGLKTLKGITENEFSPLDAFILNGKRISNISWTIPERDEERKKVLDFLQFNQTIDLKLYGGTLEKLKIDTLYLGPWTKHLRLIDMPSIDLAKVWDTLPELETFHL